MSDFVYQEGILAGTTIDINVGGKICPMTATLSFPAAAGRKIELITDTVMGAYQPTYDGNTATGLVVAIVAPVAFVRFTGIAGDKWSIR